jgi:hypothetical protein
MLQSPRLEVAVVVDEAEPASIAGGAERRAERISGSSKK